VLNSDQKTLLGMKKALKEKTMLFVMGLDTSLFNLNLQMLIDHAFF